MVHSNKIFKKLIFPLVKWWFFGSGPTRLELDFSFFGIFFLLFFNFKWSIPVQNTSIYWYLAKTQNNFFSRQTTVKCKYILSSKSSFFQCKSTFFCNILGVIKLQHLRGLRQCAYFKKLRKIQTYAFWASALSLYHKPRETRNICWATVVAFMLASMTQILPRLACCIYKVKCVLHPLIIGSAESNPWS